MQTRSVTLMLSFALGGLLESMAGFELLRPTFFPAHPTLVVLLSHLVACGLLTPGFLLLLPPAYRRDKGISIMLILGLAAPLPVVGPGLVLLFSQYLLKLDRLPKLDSSYFFGDRQYSSGANQSVGNSLTRSLLVHLRSPNVEVRRNAVLAARQLDFSSAIPILRLAQQDSDEQVRIFARNTLGQITETLEGSLKAMESPNLNPQQKLDRVLFVGEAFRAYVELGLMTEGNRKSHMDKLIGLLSQSLTAEPDNEKLLCLLLKFCLRAGDIDQARIHLRALQKLAPSPDVTLPWELALCFEDRDWPSLKEMLTSLRRNHSQDPQLMKIYNFWRQNGGQAK
jgi:HEAT repeats